MALLLLLELEQRFQVTIPDQLFIDARSVRALAQVVAGLQAKQEIVP
jgi:acyl carrier protein